MSKDVCLLQVQYGPLIELEPQFKQKYFCLQKYPQKEISLYWGSNVSIFAALYLLLPLYLLPLLQALLSQACKQSIKSKAGGQTEH